MPALDSKALYGRKRRKPLVVSHATSVKTLKVSFQIIALPLVLDHFFGSWVMVASTVEVVRDGNSLTGLLARASTLLTRLLADVLAEPVHLSKDHLLHLADIFHDLELEVERSRARRLVGGIMPDVQVSVLKSLLD